MPTRQKLKRLPVDFPESDGVNIAEIIANETWVEVESDKKVGATKGVSRDALERRNETIVNLFTMGLSARTILKQINKKCATEGWWTLEHEGSVNNIISKYFKKQRENMSSVALREEEEAMKTAYFLQQEHLIEQMVLYVNNRPESSWKPFEKVAAMQAIGNVRQQMFENRNWNASRHNPLVVGLHTNQTLNVFQDGAIQLQEEWKSEALTQLLSSLKERFEPNT